MENVLESQGPAREEQIAGEVPEDFNFNLSYDTYERQNIDTFEDSLTKDTEGAGIVEITLE